MREMKASFPLLARADREWERRPKERRSLSMLRTLAIAPAQKQTSKSDPRMLLPV